MKKAIILILAFVLISSAYAVDYNQCFNQSTKAINYYNTLSGEDKAMFWKYLDELNVNGTIAQSNGSYLISKFFANALWVDCNNMTPWRLNDYGDGDFINIVKPILPMLVENNNPWLITNHSLSLIKNNITETIYAVLDDMRGYGCRKPFTHGLGNVPIDFNYSVYSALTYDKYLKVDYVNESGYRVSLYGCHSMVNIIREVLRSINIPSNISGGYFHDRGSLSIPNVGVLLHGDSIYNTNVRFAPSSELIVPFEKVAYCKYVVINASMPWCFDYVLNNFTPSLYSKYADLMWKKPVNIINQSFVQVNLGCEQKNYKKKVGGFSTLGKIRLGNYTFQNSVYVISYFYDYDELSFCKAKNVVGENCVNYTEQNVWFSLGRIKSTPSISVVNITPVQQNVTTNICNETTKTIIVEQPMTYSNVLNFIKSSTFSLSQIRELMSILLSKIGG